MTTSNNRPSPRKMTIGPTELLFGDLEVPSEKYGKFSALVRIDAALAEKIGPELAKAAKDYFEAWKKDKANVRHKSAWGSWTMTLPVKKEIDKETGDVTGNWIFSANKAGQYKDKKTEQMVDATLPIVDAKRNPTSGRGVGRGSKVCLGVQLSPYVTPGAGKWGISARLMAVQVIEKNSGGSPSDFFTEADGFVDSGKVPAAPVEKTKTKNDSPFDATGDEGDEGGDGSQF